VTPRPAMDHTKPVVLGRKPVGAMP
jgi:hypothetical protein